MEPVKQIIDVAKMAPGPDGLVFNLGVSIIDGEPWFVAKDACKCLGLGNPSQACAGLDEDERNTIINNDSNRGNPITLVISESGLYALIFKSRRPQAQAFRRWVRKEVLPSIRKTGGYSHDLSEDYANTAYALAEQVKINARQASLNRELMLGNMQQASTIKRQFNYMDANKGRVALGAAYGRGKKCLDIDQASNELTQLVPNFKRMLRDEVGKGRQGQNLFRRWLVKHGYLYKRLNEPTEKSIKQGLMRLDRRCHWIGDRATATYDVPVITRKGLEVFCEILRRSCLHYQEI